MMLNIIKKTKIYLLLLAIGTCLSCNQNKGYKATILTDKEHINIPESYFYINERGTVFYYIQDEIKRNKILNSHIMEIKFSFRDSMCVAKPILQSMFSSDFPKSDFIFLVKKQSHKVVVDTIQEKATIVIISNQLNINDFIKKGIIRAEKIEN